jgi:hypothetical protein
MEQKIWEVFEKWCKGKGYDPTNIPLQEAWFAASAIPPEVWEKLADRVVLHIQHAIKDDAYDYLTGPELAEMYDKARREG